MNDGVFILTGPTASGKTELALALAERFDAEIVGADSRQVYREMPIGTAAPTDAERARVAHHLVAFVDPRERYSAARFVRDAAAAVDAIHARGKRAIVAGGTGFYVRSLAGDVVLDEAYDAPLRDRLAGEARVHPPDVLAAWLAALDPRAAERAIDPYRVTRALEIALSRRSAAPPIAEALPTFRATNTRYVKTYLAVDADALLARIKRRVDAMLAAGLVDEALRVGADAVAANAVGYGEALAYAAGWSTHAELRAHLVRVTRRYAKRQITWFRTEPDVVTLDPGDAYAAAVRAAREILGWS